MAQKLLVDITAHGFGHLAQTAPIVRGLRDVRPDIEVVVRTALPATAVAGRIAQPIRIVPSETDFGMVMRSPFEVDRAASYARYAELHENFAAKIAELSSWLSRESFDAVLSNISYPVIAAASAAGIPALAVSSLDWLSLFRHYCSGLPRSEAIADQIRQSYRKASAIHRLSPGLPMTDLDTIEVPVIIASVAASRRAELLTRFGRDADARIIVFAFGGMSVDEPPPRSDDASQPLLIGPDVWGGIGSWVAAASSGMPFLDLIASADVIVTKPGYGIVSEVAAAGRPTLLLSRGDWPEEPYLFAWLRRFVRCDYLRSSLEAIEISHILAWLDAPDEGAPRPRPETGGERFVAAEIARLLDASAA
jgi:hypothetical protein